AVPIVSAAVKTGVMAAFDLHELRSLIPGPVEDDEVICHAYGLGVYAALFRLVTVLRGLDGDIAMLFDHAPRPHRSIGREVYERMQAHPDSGGMLGFKDWVDSRKFMPLQAADFVAYETMKEFFQQVHDGEG